MAHGGKRTGAGRPKGIKIGTKQERLRCKIRQRTNYSFKIYA